MSDSALRLGLLAGLTLAVPATLLARPPEEERRYALIVGVQNYKKDQFKSLKYTENDANKLAQAFKAAGFKRVVLMTQSAARSDVDLQPTGRNILAQLRGLLEDRKSTDSVVVAFSGHGVQFQGEKEAFFCPMDADLKDRRTLVSLGRVYDELRGCKARVKLLLVDACRNDPLAASATRGLEKVKLESKSRPQERAIPGGVVALFSCGAGQQSYESDKVQHGVFFHNVLQGLAGKARNDKGAVSLLRLAAYVADEVPDAVKEEFGARARQRPELKGTISDAVLVPAGLGDLGLGALAGSSGKEFTNSLGMKFVLIPAGRFQMGSPASEEGRLEHEGPVHEVRISQPFWMAKHPVTVGQFRKFVEDAGYRTQAERDGAGGGGYNASARKLEARKASYSWKNPGWKQTDDHPVVNVSWGDAIAFCRWLSGEEKKTYWLPTEAEWEYACRAGTTTRYWSGATEARLEGAANIADASLRDALDPAFSKGWAFAPWSDGYPFTAPVGRFRANPWGLHDMHGNVWQWCNDIYGLNAYADSQAKDPKGPERGVFRVVRGSAWGSISKNCRCAFRYGYDPNHRDYNGGFRVVLRTAPGR